MLVCTCPNATSLPTIPALECEENFGQIQKIAFQFLNNETGKNTMSETEIKLLATWQGLKTASDATKVVVTPIVENPTFTGGDEVTFGGGNQTAGGVERTVGRNASTLSVMGYGFPQSIIKELKKIQCVKGVGVFLFNEAGKIGAIKSGDAYTPIPLRKLFVGDKSFGGFEEPDSNEIILALNPNWSDDFAVVTPSFDPVAEL